jgi:hypothetical protein
MNGSKEEFLRYLDECREKVEQWPTWKRGAVKAPNREPVVSRAASQPRPQSTNSR